MLAKIRGTPGAADKPPAPDAILADLKAANVRDKRLGLTPLIPDLYDAIKAKHPGLTEPQFHAVLHDLQDSGKLTLQAYDTSALQRPGAWKESTGHERERFPSQRRAGSEIGGRGFGPAGWVHIPEDATSGPPAPDAATGIINPKPSGVPGALHINLV